jgi:hypothetical protein
MQANAFVSDSCRVGHYSGDGVINRSSSAEAAETEAVAHGSNRNGGNGGGNIEAAEPAAEK